MHVIYCYIAVSRGWYRRCAIIMAVSPPAGVAQLAERQLSKLEVPGPIPGSRSTGS